MIYACCLLTGFEVHTAVTLKQTIFWDVAPCSPFATYVPEENATSDLGPKSIVVPQVINVYGFI
jgi:hypothetical protein